jgi:mannosyltransferase OCH1-like enzyme
MALLIPRVFHQVWLGPNPFPERFRRYQETWLEHHPDWELRFWTEETLPADLRCRAIYDRLRDPVERCDLMRLEAVWRDGGIYVDTDFECRRPLVDLLDGVDFFAAYIGPSSVNHALMGAVAGHAILDRALAEVQPRTFHGYDKEATGPLFFTRILSDFPDAKLFDRALFHPETDEEREQAHAIHHAERSWQDRDALLLRLEKANARLLKSERRQRKLQAELEARKRSRLERLLRRAVRRA